MHVFLVTILPNHFASLTKDPKDTPPEFIMGILDRLMLPYLELIPYYGGQYDGYKVGGRYDGYIQGTYPKIEWQDSSIKERLARNVVLVKEIAIPDDELPYAVITDDGEYYCLAPNYSRDERWNRGGT